MKRILLTLVTLAAVASTAGTATAATGSEQTISTGPVRCGVATCHQWRTVTTYTHGHGTLVTIQRRHRPLESRNAVPVPPWTRWRTVSGYVIPPTVAS